MEISEILSSLSSSDMENLKAVAQDLFSSEKSDDSGTLPNLDLSALTSLMKPKEDERTKLIGALKPLLSEERQRRADEAIRLLHLASMLPALRESGILDKLLGGENGLL